MSNIVIPKSKWHVFSTTYATEVTCPRCGLKQFVHVSEYGDRYKEYYPEDEYTYTITEHCDMCGEQLIITMSKEEDIMPGFWYDVCSRKDTYKDVVSVYIDIISEKYNKGRLLFYREDGWTEIILLCGDLLDCRNFINAYFTVLKKSEDQSIPIKADYFGPIFMVSSLDPLLKDFEYAQVKDVLVNGYTEYLLVCWKGNVISESNHYVIVSGKREDCYDYLFENFFITKEIGNGKKV